MKKITISPLTRVNGTWQLDVYIENGVIKEALSSGTFFRGLEEILQKRDPRDASYLTARICGICSVAHSITSTTALETGVNHEVPKNAILIRNLLYGSDILQNHLRQIYVLCILDYVEGPDRPPFTPRYTKGYRLPKTLNDELLGHYFKSIDLHRKAHEMVTLWGGKAPHNHGVVFGGATVRPTSGILKIFTSMLDDIRQFIYNELFYDLEVLSRYYDDYYQLGSTRGNFIAYGMFPKTGDKKDLHFSDGVVFNLSHDIQKLDEKKIAEYVGYSYYSQDREAMHPTQGVTRENYPKEDAYSWVKAPRYEGEPFETGPIGRLWISSKYRRGSSTLDRIYARALETKIVSALMLEWVNQLEPGKPIHNPATLPANFEGAGLTEAMRGALGHWITVRNGKIAHYQIVTPSAWNCSPKDNRGIRGPVEEALIGTPIEDINNPIEIGRIVRSFDPCLSCAVHTIEGNKSINTFCI